jgi:hypothetical protein
MLQIASENEDMDIILPSLKSLDYWVKEWCISSQEVRSLYLEISNLLQINHHR